MTNSSYIHVWNFQINLKLNWKFVYFSHVFYYTIRINLFYGKSQIYGVSVFPVKVDFKYEHEHKNSQGMVCSKSDGVLAHRGKVAINPDP